MRGATVPIILTVAAVIIALMAYQSIRRGGARFYTLEREAILRQASFSVIGSILLFLAAVALLLYDRQQQSAQADAESGAIVEGFATLTPTPFMETLPPTPTMTPTIDPDIPTPAPTAIICRGMVSGTSGNGLTLRDAPGGASMDVLAEGTIVTLLQETPVQLNNLTWLKVRSPIRLDEGWVADIFLTINDRSCIPGSDP